MQRRIIIQERTEHEGGQVTTVTQGPFLPVPSEGATSEQRSEAVRAARAAYEATAGGTDDLEHFLSDLLADMLHTMGGENSDDFSIERAVERAWLNYNEEAAE